MAKSPQKRMGRPKKSPFEKGEQFSIRLPIFEKVMLEMMARMLDTSLAKAVEYAIREVAQKSFLDDRKTLEEAAKDGFGEFLAYAGQGIHAYSSPDSTLTTATGELAAVLMSDAGKAIMMPASLRTEHEALFAYAVRDLSYYHKIKVLNNLGLALELFEMSRAAQMTGMKPFQLVDAWISKYPTPDPPEHKVWPPSGPSIPDPKKKK